MRIIIIDWRFIHLKLINESLSLTKGSTCCKIVGNSNDLFCSKGGLIKWVIIFLLIVLSWICLNRDVNGVRLTINVSSSSILSHRIHKNKEAKTKWNWYFCTNKKRWRSWIGMERLDCINLLRHQTFTKASEIFTLESFNHFRWFFVFKYA